MFANATRGAQRTGSSCADDTPAAGAAFSHTRRHTLDADEHAACLTSWQQRYDQLSAGRFDGLFEEFWFGRAQIFCEELNQTVHQTGTPWPDSRTFAVPVAIEGTGCFGGEVYGAHSMLTLSGKTEFDFRTPPRLKMLACSVDSEALRTFAQHVQRDVEAELKGHSVVSASAQQIAGLGALLSAMMSNLQAAPELLQHAAMRKAIEQGLFETLLDAASAMRTPSVESPPSLRTRQFVVARAREYMQAHIDEPITVADLCIELGVSRRKLQYSFHDVLNLNPVKFLRALRLNAVRRDLKRTDSDGNANVADVAARWGFWHQSYFSSEYKAMFGELPSETLRGKARPDATHEPSDDRHN